jgi:hypothetical protein
MTTLELDVNILPKLSKRKSYDIPSILNSDFNKVKNLQLFESWVFHEYLTNFQSLKEAKYKIIFLSIFADVNKFYLTSIPSVQQKIENISTELILSGETKYNLSHIFDKDPNVTRKKFPENMGTITFNECVQEENNINFNLAKKIYDIFSESSMLGTTIINGFYHAKTLVELNSKLNSHDINTIENVIKNMDENKGKIKVSYRDYNIMLKVIGSEDSFDNLSILKKYYEKSQDYSFDSGESRKQRLAVLSIINKKLEYFTLKDELESLTKNEREQPKKMKL